MTANSRGWKQIIYIYIKLISEAGLFDLFLITKIKTIKNTYINRITFNKMRSLLHKQYTFLAILCHNDIFPQRCEKSITYSRMYTFINEYVRTKEIEI